MIKDRKKLSLLAKKVKKIPYARGPPGKNFAGARMYLLNAMKDIGIYTWVDENPLYKDSSPKYRFKKKKSK